MPDGEVSIFNTQRMCPQCFSEPELKSGEWYCQKCQCLVKYLKPKEHHKHKFWYWMHKIECLERGCGFSCEAIILSMDTEPPKCFNGCILWYVQIRPEHKASHNYSIVFVCKKCQARFGTMR